MGLDITNFYEALPTFKGASNRLELITRGKTSYLYKDFAHAPSKVIATVKAVKNQFKNYEWLGFGVKHLPENYPLKYYRENIWTDSLMVPGTGAYAITPKGAERMLDTVDIFGIDQSDFMLNSYNINIQYVLPSPVKFNSTNLSTSYGI